MKNKRPRSARTRMPTRQFVRAEQGKHTRRTCRQSAVRMCHVASVTRARDACGVVLVARMHVYVHTYIHTYLLCARIDESTSHTLYELYTTPTA